MGLVYAGRMSLTIKPARRPQPGLPPAESRGHLEILPRVRVIWGPGPITARTTRPLEDWVSLPANTAVKHTRYRGRLLTRRITARRAARCSLICQLGGMRETAWPA